nr:MAG TPA: hypothetical protein [Caudoviricetes sp.]
MLAQNVTAELTAINNVKILIFIMPIIRYNETRDL